jgi:hypothetical protein
MGLIRSKADGQAGAFQILGAPPFSFKAVDAMWTVSWSYPLKKYGLLSGHRQGAAIQGHMPISYVEQLRSLPVRAVQQMPEVA